MKAKKIYCRFAFADKVVSLKYANSNMKLTQDDCYLVGYEDEHGKECHEDGTYLKHETQNYEKEKD